VKTLGSINLLYTLAWMGCVTTQTQTQTAWKKKEDTCRRTEDCGGKLQELKLGTNRTNQRRITNGFVQYNAGWMKNSRTNHISSMFPNKIIAIQGTKQTNDQDVVLHTNTKDHRVIHFTAKQSNLREHAGCAIMIPTEDANFIHTIGFSNDNEIRGRAGFVRLLQKDRMDITVFTVYIPVEGTRQDLTGKIWDWIEEIINKLGGVSQIYIGTDANGHTQGDPHEQDATEELPTIGMDRGGDTTEKQTTNWNGRRMIMAMKKHGMIAINTHFSGAGGDTYFTQRDGKEKSTRVE
jgi:hypothetical protein